MAIENIAPHGVGWQQPNTVAIGQLAIELALNHLQVEQPRADSPQHYQADDSHHEDGLVDFADRAFFPSIEWGRLK